MKKLLLAFAAILLSILLVVSCDKEEVETVEVEVTQEASVGFRADEKKKHIVHVAWDGNGRTKHNCDKFGMCNVVACAFCCTENGEIVPCDPVNNSENIYNAGTISIDVLTGTGELIYRLNPNDAQQNDAINNQKTYYVDQDFYVDNIKILEGEYIYNANIGEYGGYTIPVIEI